MGPGLSMLLLALAPCSDRARGRKEIESSGSGPEYGTCWHWPPAEIEPGSESRLESSESRSEYSTYWHWSPAETELGGERRLKAVGLGLSMVFTGTGLLEMSERRLQSSYSDSE